MAGLYEGGNEPAGSLKAISYSPPEMRHSSYVGIDREVQTAVKRWFRSQAADFYDTKGRNWRTPILFPCQSSRLAWRNNLNRAGDLSGLLVLSFALMIEPECSSELWKCQVLGHGGLPKSVIPMKDGGYYDKDGDYYDDRYCNNESLYIKSEDYYKDGNYYEIDEIITTTPRSLRHR
ncbi:hypothetical protein ANN_17223 [Periplaneta americana]|uniref:Uncharacterized protein n=1 Tax=Periplaneta americana TaxID=6978 RepID=A0ABQ8ST95_PERAM|nr:hypothetical protein ANN_17223 [Periplaneta americana]